MKLKESQTIDVFVYGTLMLPEIVITLTGKKFKTKDAILRGYTRYSITDPNRENKGPVLIREKDGVTMGKILLEVDDGTLKIVDKYEREFKKFPVTVYADEKEFPCFMYKFRKMNKNYLTKGWDLEKFKKLYLKTYLNRITAGKY